MSSHSWWYIHIHMYVYIYIHNIYIIYIYVYIEQPPFVDGLNRDELSDIASWPRALPHPFVQEDALPGGWCFTPANARWARFPQGRSNNKDWLVVTGIMGSLAKSLAKYMGNHRILQDLSRMPGEKYHGWLVVTGTWLDDFPVYIGNFISPTDELTPSYFSEG